MDTFTSYYSEQQAEPALYKQINESLGRADMIMKGRHKANVMLYYPIETFQMHHKGSAAFYGEYCAEENACAEGLRSIFYGLLDRQINFDFTDCEYLEKCHVRSGGLHTPTGHIYSALVLPPMEICDRAAAILQKFAEQGLIILSPQSDIFPAISQRKFATMVENEVDLCEKLPTHELPCFAATPTHGVVCKCVLFRGLSFLFVNAEEHEQHVTVTLGAIASDQRGLVLYDPFTEQILPATFTKLDDEHVQASFDIGALQTVIVTNIAKIQ